MATANINTGHTRLGTTDSGLEVSGIELGMAPRYYLNVFYGIHSRWISQEMLMDV